MTSSLPDFSPSPSAAPVADGSSLATLFPAAGDPAAEFAALMGAAPVPPVGTVPEAPVAVVACAITSSRLLATPELVTTPADAGLITVDPVRVITAAPVVAGDPVVEVAPLVETTEPAEPASAPEITRDMLEEAATFVTSLLQTLLPEVPLPELSAVAYQRVAEAAGEAGGHFDASELARTFIAPANALAVREPAVAKSEPGPKVFTVAADGALGLNLDLAQFQPGELTAKLPPPAAMEVSAELQRPGEITVRLQAAALVAGAAESKSPVPAPALGREIFAGKLPTRPTDPESLVQSVERNFVFTGDKRVKSSSPVAGISVAKTETIMPAAPIEETRATRNPDPTSVLPLRVDFQVAAPPAERITVPVSAPAGQNFAERAVETVTNLVETQFTASMQKAGTVHLQLRFGGEDLSVRVELKDGAVQTDFRTDSPELRSVLAREWQAVVAQSPEQMRRYLEPVFAPHTPSATAGSDDTPSFSSRQQQQAQQEQSSRPAREVWDDSVNPFARRSHLSDSFVPEPAVARGPAFLPTSSRLSVLA